MTVQKLRRAHGKWLLFLPTALLMAGCITKDSLTDAEAYVTRGFAHMETGDYDQAIVEFTKALEINPRFAQAYTAPEREPRVR